MSKNENLPTMYESIPAVAALNRVPGFDPFKLLRRAISPDNGDEVMQLDLPYKKLWFRLANPKGRIRLNALRITEQLAIFEAQVYLDRSDENPIGNFTSSCMREDAPGGQYVQAAQYEAVDRALTDAGFGLQFADVEMGVGGSRYGSRILMQSAGNAENGKSTQSAMAQSQPQPVRNVETSHTVMAQDIQPSGMKSPQPAMVQRQSPQPAGSAKAEQAAAAQGQSTRSTANAESSQQHAAQMRTVGDKIPVQAPMAAGEVETHSTKTQGKTVPQSSLPVQPSAVNRQTTQAVDVRLPVQSSGVKGQVAQPAGVRLPVQPSAVRGQSAQSVGVCLPVQPSGVKGQAAQPMGVSLPIQPQAVWKEVVPSVKADGLPVRAEDHGSLPVQPVVGTAPIAAGTETLPAAGVSREAGKIQETVQGAMALLGGQESLAIAEDAPIGKANAASMKAASAGQQLHVRGSQAQAESQPRYTANMPVEEIVKLMTFEEAGKVVVDTGVCRGMTIAEVAKRRPPSLKFYLYGGYKGDDNILRAAAQIMLDAMAAQKAG